MRSLRTADYLYIHNFAPERWPMGSPGGVTETETPDGQALEKVTYTAFSDMDASPTKAWLIEHRNEPAWKPLYERAFGKRVEEEFYDLRRDPDQMNNVSTDPAYAAEKAKFAERLKKSLVEAGDPRVTGDGQTFERPPFTDATKPRKNAAPNKPIQ
jgi:uncharacterized sulfatase